MTTHMTEPVTYNKGAGPSYFRDIALNMMGVADSDVKARLRSHEDDVVASGLKIGSVAGVGLRVSPPQYLAQEAKAYSAASRRYTNLMDCDELPAGTDSINVPKVFGKVDPEQEPDKFIYVPVRTIFGQQAVKSSLLEQMPIALDQILWRDLLVDYSMRLNQQVIHTDGMAPTLRGTRQDALKIPVSENSDIYTLLCRAVHQISSTRFLPPTDIVMHPRRWAAMLVDFGPYTDNEERWKYVEENDQGCVGYLCIRPQPDSEPINIPVTCDADMIEGEGSAAQDFIHVMRSRDNILWESNMRVRCMYDFPNDNVIFQTYAYVAFTAQRYKSTVELFGPGLSTPNYSAGK